jgi:hypothetical protein
MLALHSARSLCLLFALPCEVFETASEIAQGVCKGSLKGCSCFPCPLSGARDLLRLLRCGLWSCLSYVFLAFWRN